MVSAHWSFAHSHPYAVEAELSLSRPLGLPPSVSAPPLLPQGLTPAPGPPPRRVPLKEWTTGQPMELIVLTGQRGGIVPYGRLFDIEEAINLDL